MFDNRRYLGTFAVLSLVLLRLVIGWHFFREGTKKLEYDRRDGELSLAADFTSEGFLSQAKGPLAPLYLGQVAADHGWRDLLAVPHRNAPVTEDEAAEQTKWLADYGRRQAADEKKGGPLLIEFAPFLGYHEWATRISDDWRAVLNDVKLVPGLKDEQKKAAEAAYTARMQQLATYLAGEGDAIASYRHDLWRLENWRDAPEAGDVPFHDARIVAKTAETSGKAAAWVSEVRNIEAGYYDDLRRVLAAKEQSDAKTAAAVDDAITGSQGTRLHAIDVAVTWLTVGVGVCLLLGLFTRLASVAGALFLASVVASQPPWLMDAAPTMPQIIEFAGLLVLAGTGAGRWLGLDYFFYALFNRNRHRDVEG